METMGRHVISELWECDGSLLNDQHKVEQIMVDAALEASAEVREVTFHKFTPHGVSGVVIISESHLTIHSFPEHGYASVDVYTCGDRIDPMVATQYITRSLRAGRTETLKISRGTGSFEATEERIEVAKSMQ